MIAQRKHCGPKRDIEKHIARVRKAVVMQLAGRSHGEIAAAVGVGTKSLGNWQSVYREQWETERARALEICAAFVGLHTEAPIDGETAAAMIRCALAAAGTRDGEAVAEERERAPISCDMTLGQFFAAYAWPDCLAPKGDNVRTLRDYERSLAYWRALTGDPPLAEIDQRTCSTFLRRLAGLNPEEIKGMRRGGGGPTSAAGSDRLSPNTVRKHWQNLQRLLCWTGPSSRHVPEGAGLVANPPWAPMPRPDRPGPRPAMTLDEIGRWLDVLPQAETALPMIPPFVDPAAWWRALILVAYNTGLRPGGLMRLEWGMIDGHRLNLPPSIAKGRRGYLLWINSAALRALEPIRRPSGLVFGWPGWPNGESSLKKARYRLQREAGIPSRSFYALRRAFATQAAKINPLAAQLQMGHRGLGMAMMIEHYLDHEQTLRDALEKLPQPVPAETSMEAGTAGR